MTPKEKAFQTLSAGLMKKLEDRGMDSRYFDNSAQLREYLKQDLPENSVISWGGSESLKESGVMDLLRQGNYDLIDRALARTPEEDREIYSRTVLADYYFMSSNALTMDGELVNIDGKGNRVACMIQGPAHVYIVVGRNKITAGLEDAILRVRNLAAPANAIRLGRQTPCQNTGRCGDCFAPECICSHMVITRRCGQKGRIKILLVNEELGY